MIVPLSRHSHCFKDVKGLIGTQVLQLKLVTFSVPDYTVNPCQGFPLQLGETQGDLGRTVVQGSE